MFFRPLTGRVPFRGFCTLAAKTEPKSRFTIGKVLGTSTLLAGTACTGLYFADEGFNRSVKFWTFAFPRFVHYKYVEYKTLDQSDEEITKAFQVLHDKYSPQAEKIALQLRGYYLKSAQLMSTMDSFIPEPYLTWCKKLQNEVPSELNEETVRDVIESSLNIKIEDVFSEFDFTPVGVASIGQVYKAKLKDPVQDPSTKEKISQVAVKIQSPGIERRFRSDISTLKSFCAISTPHFVAPLDEIEKQFKTEFDFNLEADNLRTVHGNIMPVFGDKVKIPLPVDKYCTRNVLVMEFLEGNTFIDAIKQNFQQAARISGQDYDKLEQQQLEKIRLGHLQSIEEQSRDTKNNQKMLNAQRRFRNAAKFLFNNSLGIVAGRFEYDQHFEMINLAEVIETVANVHGHQIMVDGCVQGDPHPGNILYLNDGRLGLIDYGQVKKLSKDFREAYAEMILALHDNDVERVADIAYNKWAW